MTHLRNIAFDLVEKRLWPVAVALLAAVVAVPLLLGADAAPAPATPPVALDGGRPTTAQVSVAVADPLGGPLRLGPLRDPFARTRAAAPAAAPAAASAGGGQPRSATTTGGASAAPDTPGGPGEAGLPAVGGALPEVDLVPVPGDGAAPAVAGPDVVTVRVGRAGDLDLRRDVSVRTPLPSVADPFLVYLGNKPDGASAQFLVSGDAVLSGEGGCRPTPELCEELVLRAGMTAFFDVAGPEGEVVRHRLEVVRVGRG